MSSIRYRPDIDGLRALAVLLVVIFHADLGAVKGGYIGVDVFFVISGFLITSLLLADLRNGTFELLSFWERRIRRILPALLVVTLFTLLAGWFIYLPKDYEILGQQAASQSVFSSNFLFYSLTGYFATGGSTKPLLHTWSLAVEEQYYLFFPFLIALLFKFVRAKIVYILIALMVASFAASVWAVARYPDAAFYLLPFRAWELLIGSLLAFVPVKEAARRGWLNEVLAFAGVIAIVAPGFLYTDETHFPGIAALAPCLGAAAIIFTGGRGTTWVARALSKKPVVFTGLISYSLYLWHWPLLMFAEYIPLFQPRSGHRIALVLLSFVLAYLTWKYVEQPFRRKRFADDRHRERKMVYGGALAALAVMALAGFCIMQAKGVPSRWSPQSLQYAAGRDDRNPHSAGCVTMTPQMIANGDLCQTNPSRKKIDFIVWGDSFADAAGPVFYDLSKKYNKNGYYAARHSCGPLVGMYQNASNSRTCHNFNDAIFETIKREKIKNVILISNWVAWFREKGLYYDDMSWHDAYKNRTPNLAIAGALHTIDMLRAMGVHVTVVLGTPTLSFNAPLMLSYDSEYVHKNSQGVTMPKKKYLKDRAKGVDSFVSLIRDQDIAIVDPIDLFCPNEDCVSSKDGYALYHDSNHWTTKGAAFATPLMDDTVKNLR